MSKSFRESLMNHISDGTTSLRAISESTGVSYEQLKKLKQGKSLTTNVDDAILIASHFGLTVDEFMGDRSKTYRAEILELFDALSSEEQDFLLAAARGISSKAHGEEPK